MPVMKKPHITIKKLFSYILIISIFTSCATPIKSIFSDSDVYKKGVDDTLIKHIVDNNETVSIINASYLNNIYPNQYDDKYDNFLVGIYVSDYQNIDLSNEPFSLKVNDKSFDKFLLIDKSDTLYKKAPIRNPYAKYYIISFLKSQNRSNITLEYKYSIYKKVTLPFEVN
jgi:hypothetical protein